MHCSFRSVTSHLARRPGGRTIDSPVRRFASPSRSFLAPRCSGRCWRCFTAVAGLCGGPSHRPRRLDPSGLAAGVAAAPARPPERRAASLCGRHHRRRDRVRASHGCRRNAHRALGSAMTTASPEDDLEISAETTPCCERWSGSALGSGSSSSTRRPARRGEPHGEGSHPNPRRGQEREDVPTGVSAVNHPLSVGGAAVGTPEPGHLWGLTPGAAFRPPRPRGRIRLGARRRTRGVAREGGRRFAHPYLLTP